MKIIAIKPPNKTTYSLHTTKSLKKSNNINKNYNIISKILEEHCNDP